MDKELELAVGMVPAFLDIIVILLLEDNPVRGIVIVGLVRTVTNNELIRIMFTLLIIVLAIIRESEPQH